MSKAARKARKERRKLLSKDDLSILAEHHRQRTMERVIVENVIGVEPAPVPQDRMECFESLTQVDLGLELLFDGLSEQARYLMAGNQIVLKLVLDLQNEVRALRTAMAAGA